MRTHISHLSARGIEVHYLPGTPPTCFLISFRVFLPQLVLMPIETFDIAIIGAGPAGNFAALTAAKAGLSTIVLEEHETIGQPVHCGECLSLESVQRMGLELPDEATPLAVAERLGIPRTASLWALVDGRRAPVDEVLRDGSSVSLFQPVGGVGE